MPRSGRDVGGAGFVVLAESARAHTPHPGARYTDRLTTIRLRMLIFRELEDCGITTPAAIGAALGMPGVEAIRLPIRH
jgi:hypothetical protein